MSATFGSYDITFTWRGGEKGPGAARQGVKASVRRLQGLSIVSKRLLKG